MTLTLFQGHRCVRNINHKLCVLGSCLLLYNQCMFATYIKKIMHMMICVTGVYSRETIKKNSLVKCLGLLKTFPLGFTQSP